MEKNARKIAELLKVLANTHRLLVLCVLLSGPETVGDIEKQISGISQSALSQHLSLLKAHGALKSEKVGQNVIYSIADNRIKSVIDVLKTNYCEENK